MKILMNILPVILVVLLWVDDAEEVYKVGFINNGIG